MLLQVADFNGSDKVISALYPRGWKQLERVLQRMPLHLKASDQAGIQGKPIFDPVGTNGHIKAQIAKLRGWHVNLPIPPDFAFLGTDVDFILQGLLVEVQFSNYPFLLNNVVRSELFFKSKTLFAGKPIEAAIIVTKAGMFPASNSTLYFEQAQRQLTALVGNNVFDVPIRLVGLFEKKDATVSVRFSSYSSARYSRTVTARERRRCRIKAGRADGGRCILEIID